MGTNYYAVKNRPSIADPIHIGKSSFGWMFLFCEHNDKWEDPPVVWNSFEEVKSWLEKYVKDEKQFVILDEYDREISLEDFLNMVARKQEEDKGNPENFMYNKNIDGYRFLEEGFC